MKTTKCQITPTNVTPRQAKELLIDHVLSGVAKDTEGYVYKPNPHNVTGDQIQVDFTDPQTGKLEKTVKDALEYILQKIADEYNNRQKLTIKMQDYDGTIDTKIYDTKSDSFEVVFRALNSGDIDNIL